MLQLVEYALRISEPLVVSLKDEIETRMAKAHYSFNMARHTLKELPSARPISAIHRGLIGPARHNAFMDFVIHTHSQAEVTVFRD